MQVEAGQRSQGDTLTAAKTYYRSGHSTYVVGLKLCLGGGAVMCPANRGSFAKKMGGRVGDSAFASTLPTNFLLAGCSGEMWIGAGLASWTESERETRRRFEPLS